MSTGSDSKTTSVDVNRHNREGWLTEMVERMRLDVFRGFRLGKVRATCGWPCKGALSARRRIGECHPAESSADGTHELFVSPLLAKVDDVAGTLCHEVAHVAAGIKAAHGPGFKRVCAHVGLTRGKATSASPGDRLADKLRSLAGPLGPYPHAAMSPVGRKVSRVSSVVALECAEECGCRVTISRKMLAEHGAPTCACGGKFETVE